MIKNIDFKNEKYTPIMTPKFLSNLYGAYNPKKAVIELIDNAIDAQATHINIVCCKNADTTLIVSDNGNGIKNKMIHNVLDFGVSDKTINYNAIGCFGCGLKAVPYHLIDEQFNNLVTMKIDTICNGIQTIAERQISNEDTTQSSLIWNVSTRETFAKNGTTITLDGINISKKDIVEIKNTISVRYYRFLEQNKCQIIFNDENIEPVDILFSTNSFIKKETLKTNDDKKLKVSIKYVSLDRNDKKLKTILKKYNSQISNETSGIYIFCGDICITCGGVDSWKHIKRKWWSPLNNVRIAVDVPIEYKNLLLDSDKTKVKTYLSDMKTIDDKCIFCDVINYINNLLPKQEKKKTISNKKQKTQQISFKAYQEPIFNLWNKLPESRTKTKCMKQIYKLISQMFEGKAYNAEIDSDG